MMKRSCLLFVVSDVAFANNAYGCSSVDEGNVLCYISTNKSNADLLKDFSNNNALVYSCLTALSSTIKIYNIALRGFAYFKHKTHYQCIFVLLNKLLSM